MLWTRKNKSKQKAFAACSDGNEKFPFLRTTHSSAVVINTMNVHYQLSNSDFLEHLLYTSSKSKMDNKKRFRTRIRIPVVYILLALFFYFKNENPTSAIIFSGIAVLWFFLYPTYSKWSYKKHLQKHVEVNYKNRINKPVEISFDQNSMFVKDFTSESRIDGTELKELIETKNHFFIKLTTDLSLIIPKSSIENQIEFKKDVIDLGAIYVDELNWVWK